MQPWEPRISIDGVESQGVYSHLVGLSWLNAEVLQTSACDILYSHLLKLVSFMSSAFGTELRVLVKVMTHRVITLEGNL